MKTLRVRPVLLESLPQEFVLISLDEKIKAGGFSDTINRYTFNKLNEI